MPLALKLVLLTVLLVGSAFFSGAETALFALTGHDLYRFQHDRRASHRLVAVLMQHPRRLLLTLMVGNITINMFIFATSLSLFQRITGPDSLLAPVLGLIAPVLVTLFGEMLPKATAIVLGSQVAVRAAPLVRLCQVALTPITIVLNSLFVEPITRLVVGARQPSNEVTVEELRELIETSQKRRIIDADENAMLNGVFKLHEVKVRNIMVPRVDIIAFEVHDDPEELRRILRERHLTKIPVYVEEIDRIIGQVYARDLFLNPREPLQRLIRPVIFVPEIIALTQLLSHFRQTHSQLAMVVDEYGGVVGLITIEDVAEQIVGELSAPGDEEELPTWERLDDRHYRISGRVNVRDWADEFRIRGFDERITTLGGLVVAHLGRLPSVGDQVRLGNLLLSVESLHGRRIDWLRLELTEKAKNPATSPPEHEPPGAAPTPRETHGKPDAGTSTPRGVNG